MAEDQCLIQYVRDNFGHEFAYNFVTMQEDDTSYAFDDNTFTESSTFAADPSSPVTTLAPNLFGSPSSPSLSAELPSAMESTPYLETATGCYSPPGEPGLQVPSVLSNLHLATDRPPLNEKEYPMLASYGFAQPEHGFQPQSCEGITLDEMLQDQFVANSGISSSTGGEGERGSSFWRGKTPALLMQQLKGPSLSASSSSSEARSNLRSPPFHHSPCAQTPASRTPLNLTSLCNRVGEFKSYSFGAHHSPGVEPVSKSGPGFSRQSSLPPLGDTSIDVKFKSILSPGRSNRLVQSPGSFQGDHGELEQGNIKQRRKIMPGLAVLGEMQLQRSAASGNNSWSSSSTSPGPVSRVEHENELLAANFDFIRQRNGWNSSMSPSVAVGRDFMGGDRSWKKAKGVEFQGCGVSEDAVQAAILATAMVEQKEKNQLREKFLALLQIDSSTSKDYKAQILDDTIRYLKDLRRRLNFNEADSTPNSIRIPDSGFEADKSTEASPTTSSRCRPHGEGLPSPVRLKDLQLETAGVEISPHLTVDSGPHIEVRTMENQHLMVKLTAKDRPGLFSDIVVALRRLRLDIQHANIRTGNNGQRNDIFAAKDNEDMATETGPPVRVLNNLVKTLGSVVFPLCQMQLPFFSGQSTHSIAMALNQVISASASPEPYTPLQILK